KPVTKTSPDITDSAIRRPARDTTAQSTAAHFSEAARVKALPQTHCAAHPAPEDNCPGRPYNGPWINDRYPAELSPAVPLATAAPGSSRNPSVRSRPPETPPVSSSDNQPELRAA